MIPIASIMRMWWKWVGFDNNDEDKNEKDNCDEDDGGNLAGVLPIVLWSDPLNPQVVPVLAETLVPANLFLGSDDDQVDNSSVVVDDDVGDDGGIVVDYDNDDSLNSLHLDVSSKDDPASLELTGIIFQLWNERATRWKG